jgi:hypothetical protein
VAGGGGGGAGRAPLTGPARVSFTARADRLCRRSHVAVGKVGRRLRDLASAAQRRRVSRASYLAGAADLTAQAARIARGALDSLRALPDPHDARFTAYLRASSLQVGYLNREVPALRRGDLRATGRLNAALGRNGRRVQTAARSFGFRVCGG